jgi:geranylgeranyl reductase family protein
MSMVTVVGAGPAGATAARALARAGVTVRLLDRSKFPRNKPCGGAISMRALARFPYLESELARIATHAVSRLHLEGPDGRSTVVESDGPAVVLVRRVEFDALLVSLAVEAGAELITGAEIVQASQDGDGVALIARDGRRFDAPLVIAADGVNSVLARRLGLHAGWPSSMVALDMMEETPRTELRDADPTTLWVAYGYEPPGGSRRSNPRRAAEGYAYVFPKRDHVNVGVGYVLQHFRSAVDVAPYQLQRDFVRDLRRRGVMEGESVRQNFTPFHIPVGGPLRRPGRGRVLLAGDAGGFVNGLTAEGIYYAMVSGELAAKAVIATGPQRVGRLAARYRHSCDREIGTELRDSVLLQRHLFARRGRVGRIVDGSGREAGMTHKVLEFAVGRVPYPDLRRYIIRRAPLLAAGLAWQAAVKRFSRADRGAAR